MPYDAEREVPDLRTARRVLSETGSGSEENLCVRPHAHRWLPLLELVDTLRDAVSSGSESVLLPGLSQLTWPLAKTASSFPVAEITALMRPPKEWRQPGSLGLVYKDIERSFSSYAWSCAAAYPLRRAPEGLCKDLRAVAAEVGRYDDVRPSSFMLAVLSGTAVEVARSVHRVKSMMGPRDPELIDRIQSRVRSASAAAGRLQSLVLTRLASGGTSDALLRGTADALREHAILADDASPCNGAPKRQFYDSIMKHESCHLGTEHAAHRALAALAYAASDMTDAAAEVLDGSCELSVDARALLTETDWRSDVDAYAGSAIWHLGRSRHSPRLWS